ncbi:MAG: acetolactate decarboxylase [Pirellulaceae bacterium]|nr:acetolactate decarboxylase [Pirellulaceae bacterium]
MLIRIGLGCAMLLLAGFLGVRNVTGADAETWDGTIVQYGRMHEAIGQQQHQGRVELKTLVERPHFYGVAALARLEGEVTILDGKVTVTCVDDKGRLEPDESTPLDNSATLLVGAYVPAWTEHKVTADVAFDELDQFLADAAAKAGVSTEKPFVFTLEGEFSGARLHVINGACPLHARLRKLELPKERQPVEVELDKIRGTVVGVFAKDAVGDITHPATSTHMHLVFTDGKSDKTITGHVEQIGLLRGVTVRLPK